MNINSYNLSKNNIKDLLDNVPFNGECYEIIFLNRQEYNKKKSKKLNNTTHKVGFNVNYKNYVTSRQGINFSINYFIKDNIVAKLKKYKAVKFKSTIMKSLTDVIDNVYFALEKEDYLIYQVKIDTPEIKFEIEPCYSKSKPSRDLTIDLMGAWVKQYDYIVSHLGSLDIEVDDQISCIPLLERKIKSNKKKAGSNIIDFEKDKEIKRIREARLTRKILARTKDFGEVEEDQAPHLSKVQTEKDRIRLTQGIIDKHNKDEEAKETKHKKTINFTKH